MMVNIKARKINLKDDIRNYIDKRMEKFDKMLGGVDEIFVTVSQQKNTKKVEVTIPLNGVILRSEEAGDDLPTCVDNVVEKLERQVRKHKTRLARRMRDGSETKRMILELPELPNDEVLVRSKHFETKPFSVDEAIMQMDLLGHAFFAFVNEETEQINVVYHRHDGGYGLLEPEV